MKFNEIPYKRPDLKSLEKNIDQLLSAFNAASSVKEQVDLIDKINILRSNFDTMMNVASIKYTVDTTSEFNQQEQDYFDDSSPEFASLINKFYKAIVGSKFRSELEKKYGKQLFSIAEQTLKTFSDEVIDDLKKENQLSSEYTKLIASAQLQFNGGVYTLSELGPFLNDIDRNVRKTANEVRYKFFVENAAKFDSIYDDLVKVRALIAKKLGFNNFVELGYARMLRSDYNAAMVADYREKVLKYIVPISTKLKDKQAKRLGLDHLLYYDEPLMFKNGNPNPKGDADWIVSNAEKMYNELSAETKVFFDFMVNNELMDLVSRKGKAGGGYCTYISDYKSPFIFSNFNGTTHDVEVLTHEAGHAFQAFESRDLGIPEYNFPTYEACEIHSMSMEFLTWPWMNLFFKEDTEKFKYVHLVKSLQFLPYGVTVDEFQHWIYENPTATPAERNAQFRVIEKKYLPKRDYDGNAYLEGGAYWQQQAHIYQSPFYYIDYTLAQICAFQFWSKANHNREQAMKDYIHLCKQGGNASFLELVKVANLNSPFSGGCLESVANEVNVWLEQVDDTRL